MHNHNYANINNNVCYLPGFNIPPVLNSLYLSVVTGALRNTVSSSSPGLS